MSSGGIKMKYVIEDLYGFRIPIWVIDEEKLKVAIKLGLLKKVVNPRVSGVRKKRGAKK